MTGDKLLDAMEHIDADLIEAADGPVQKRRKPWWIAAVAAILAIVLTVAGLVNPRIPTITGTDPAVIPTLSGIQNPGSLQLNKLIAGPEYPEMVQKPNYEDYSDWQTYETAYSAWRSSQMSQYDQPEGYADSLTEFFHSSMAEFLQGEGNPTYSPLNVYMAMAMLAETTAGNSRQQILELFGLDSIEQLREQASHVWNAHYSDDGETTLLMANSVWLDNFYSFHQDTADLLAGQYYASSFSGDLGTGEMNQQLQAWLNANTGGLLEEQTKNVELNPETVFALASTIYFTAGWENEFSASQTQDAIFHCADMDLMTPFMNQSLTQHTYFRGENFGAIYLYLSGGNRMWLILPDEGHTVAEILESEEYLRMTLDPSNWKNRKQYTINLRLPKFDVVSQTDLIEGMKKLGVTDIFNSEISDFTPMTDTPSLYVSKINHAARVAIDEEGCIAAAFTVIAVDGEGMPAELEKMDFVLDRPFLFMVSSRDNLPLFAGIVNEP